jgi:predicted transcriptional regulator
MTKGKDAAADRHSLTVTVEAEMLADIDRLAAEFGDTREHLLATAVMRFVHEELQCLPADPDDPLANLPPYEDPTPEGRALDLAGDEAAHAFAAYVKIGEDQADRGEVFSQEEMEDWFLRHTPARGRSAAAE